MAPGTKLGILSQDQFAFEEMTVIDAVIMGDRGTLAGEAGARCHLFSGGNE